MNLEAVVQTVPKPQPQARAVGAQPSAAQSAQPAKTAAPEVVVAPQVEPVEPPAADAVKAAAAQIETYLKSVGRNLDIYVDRDTGKTIVTVRDSATGDVIRQIPGEETLRLARSLGEHSSALVNLTV